MSKQTIIIGSGFSSLSAACYLAQMGYEVTVLEKHSGPGGRARQFTNDGYTFDMGPSWYWMPDVFERFFNDFGKSASDYYELIRLDPSYRIFFGEDDYWDIPAEMDALEELFESVERGSSKQLRVFLEQAAYKYEVGIHDLVYKPSLSITEFIDTKLLSGVLKMDVFKSFHKHIRSFFKNDRLLQLMEFPVLFLGATPKNTPALYSLMNYADIKLGTWYPKGGMYQIVKGMHSLAESLGVQFKFNEEVQQLEVTDNYVSNVVTSKGAYEAATVVGGADYHHIDRHLLKDIYSNYSEKYWNSRTLAPSSLIFYLGINKKLKNLQHHNLFFDKDFTVHAKEIYDQPQWPSQPLFYVSCTSITDISVAPLGHENLFVLIPVAPGLEDNEELREYYYQLVMGRLEKLTGQLIRDAVVSKRSYAHQDFIDDYSALKGNAYGLANTLKQTAILKPSLKNKKYITSTILAN